MLNQREIKTLLQWYVDMGVDETTTTIPCDFSALKQKTAAKPAILEPSKSASKPHNAAASPSINSASLASVIAEARELADKAKDLASLEAAVKDFNGCELKKMAKNTVFADGNPESDVMLIGEAPGADEDRQGIPFCGASGQLLDEMLKYAGLTRAETFYITNTLFWRPPGNRTPTADEIEICRPFVEKHIALINPKIIVLVGGTSAKAILKESRGITKLRTGKFSYSNDYLDHEIPVRVIFHPSYLLRQPLQKKLAWQDILDIREYAQNELAVKFLA